MLTFGTVLVVLCLKFLFVTGHSFATDKVDVGEPLILTPLLESGRVTEAKRKSRVCPDIANTTSYSGYFTVNQACESNLFFWFFPAQQNQAAAPVVLFLQGGPGRSSIYSLFVENGPLTYKETLGTRQYSWNVKNNLIYIDQPVGTGYSFTRKGCYAENETVLGEELYSAMVQFYQLFPELRSNKFIVTGNSYAGKYIPALGHTIHKNNPTAQVKINLSVMMIGNGWMDAVDQIDLGSYLYQLGLVDTTGRDVYYDYQRRFLEHMQNKEYEEALKLRHAELDDMFEKVIGNVSNLNYLQPFFVFPREYENFIKSPEIRRAIHVGNSSYVLKNDIVGEKLGVDYVLSIKPWVEELLQHYPILFYTGPLDIYCPYPAVENFQNNLHWCGETHFKNATRQKWCVNGAQVGYLKNGHNLYDVMVRNAGHSVPLDQPELGYILVNSASSSNNNDPFHALDRC